MEMFEAVGDVRSRSDPNVFRFPNHLWVSLIYKLRDSVCEQY
jgi:hypothetical protein